MGALCSICFDSTDGCSTLEHSKFNKMNFALIFSCPSFEQLPFVSCGFVGTILLTWFPCHFLEFDSFFCCPPKTIQSLCLSGISRNESDPETHRKSSENQWLEE